MSICCVCSEWGEDDGEGGGGDAEDEGREKQQRHKLIMDEFRKRRQNQVWSY